MKMFSTGWQNVAFWKNIENSQKIPDYAPVSLGRTDQAGWLQLEYYNTVCKNILTHGINLFTTCGQMYHGWDIHLAFIWFSSAKKSMTHTLDVISTWALEVLVKVRATVDHRWPVTRLFCSPLYMFYIQMLDVCDISGVMRAAVSPNKSPNIVHMYKNTVDGSHQFITWEKQEKQTPITTTLILWLNITSQVTLVGFFGGFDHNKNKRLTSVYCCIFDPVFAFCPHVETSGIAYTATKYESKKHLKHNWLCTQTDVNALSGISQA